MCERGSDLELPSKVKLMFLPSCLVDVFWDVSFCVDLVERITPDYRFLSPDYQNEALVRLIPSMCLSLVIGGSNPQVIARIRLPFLITDLLGFDYC